MIKAWGGTACLPPGVPSPSQSRLPFPLPSPLPLHLGCFTDAPRVRVPQWSKELFCGQSWGAGMLNPCWPVCSAFQRKLKSNIIIS